MRLDVGQTAIIERSGVTRLIPAFAAAIPLGHLFDDSEFIALSDAVASDTYKATAEYGDLGIDRVVRGGDSPGTTQTIAPDIAIDLDALGWSNASTHRAPANAAWGAGGSDGGIRVTGVRAKPSLKRLDPGVGMHANTIVTFDLRAIRAAGGLAPSVPMRFIADHAGLNDEALGKGSVHMAAIVSDEMEPLEAVGPRGRITFESGESPAAPQRIVLGKPTTDTAAIEINLPAGARWLTLICASADGNINSDHGAFVGARIEIGPKKTPASETTQWNDSKESDGQAQR